MGLSEKRLDNPWVILAFVAGGAVAVILALIVFLGDATKVALRTYFAGHPYEVYEHVDEDECPNDGLSCLTLAVSDDLTHHAVVLGTDGGLWSSSFVTSESSVGQQQIRKRVFVSPIPGRRASRVSQVLRTSMGWAATDADQPSATRSVLIVVPDSVKRDSEASEDRREYYLSHLAGEWRSVVVGESDDVVALWEFDLIVIDTGVAGAGTEIDDLRRSIASTSVGVVSVAPSQWPDHDVDVVQVSVEGSAVVVVSAPDAFLTRGIYGQLPEVTVDLTSTAIVVVVIGWWVLTVLTIGCSLVLEGHRLAMMSETDRVTGDAELKKVLSPVLFDDLAVEALRYQRWNSAFSAAAVIGWLLGTAVFIYSLAILLRPGPADVVMFGRNLGYFAGGVGWVATGVAVATVGRLFFSARHRQRFRRVFQAGNSAPPDDYPTLDPVVGTDADRHHGAVGVCLSGGGLRSAAYGLGALQTLQENSSIWESVRFVSAVSGGSYIAAAYAVASKAIHDRGLKGYRPKRWDTPDPETGRLPYSIGSDEERHLRNNTNYLAPTAVDKLRVFAEWLSGFLINLAVLTAALWLVAAAVAIVARSAAVAPNLSILTLSGDEYTVARVGLSADTAADALAVALVVAALASVISSIAPNSEARHSSRRVAEVFLWVTLGLLVVLVLVPGAYRLWRMILDAAAQVPALSATLAGVAVVSWIGATLRTILARNKASVAAAVAGIALPIAALVFVSWAGWQQISLPLGWIVVLALVAVAVFAVFGLWLPTMRPSIHPLYRRALNSTYGWFGGEAHDTALEALTGYTPQLTVSAAANYGPSPVTPPGRAALPYAFAATASGLETDGTSTPDRGSPWLARTADLSSLFRSETRSVYISDDRVSGSTTGKPKRHDFVQAGFDGSEAYELERRESKKGRGQEGTFKRGRGRDFGVMDAVAISGAAVSPSMGKRTMALYRAMLAVFNLRLGIWLPNPLLRHLWAEPQAGAAAMEGNDRKRFEGSPRHIPWFMNEVLGNHSPIGDFVYVTDGGHYDNLGLMTLLRKRCRRIICFDAGGEDVDTFTSIAQAMMLAEAELGISMDFHPSPDLWPPVPKDDWETPSGAGGSEDAGGRRFFPRRRASSADDYPEVARDHTTVTFRYADDTDDVPDCVLIYCKTTVTVTSPWSVKDYRIRNPNFPNIPTLRQLYDDERFEAYRELGVEAARGAIATLLEDAAASEPSDEPC